MTHFIQLVPTPDVFTNSQQHRLLGTEHPRHELCRGHSRSNHNGLFLFLFFQEIVTALSCGKNIVPIIDGFEWPEPQALPEDMQAVLTFNGIK